MRVRITRKLPAIYGNGVNGDSMLVGRVYNLAPPLASALLVDGYAELYETLTPAEKRQRLDQAAHTGWAAHDRNPRWTIPSRRKKS